ncbi:glycosyltransferase family 2 protein [Sphingomonas gei]|uniref:glycosyltransferase family 2 protein n=1 Tax=Sphingomonas gei TaxID=1395960 RepID=UPI0019D01CF4|nr:glycosyltransferase family 2 protein [Sphingomonas gei]
MIIPAYDAAATIGRAVASALAQPEVAEVIVVDDASGDATIAQARAADDGSQRLSVLALPDNRGPSAARNAAIHAGRAPLLAILDADDFLLPGRFARLLARPGWDFIADNILFVPEGAEDAPVPVLADRHRRLALHEFVARNISRPGHPRAELGFLKPLIRRAALEKIGLRYQEDIRLGEDYLLYAEALARGAVFELSEACGYVAVERATSLSGRHRTEDLGRLLAADRRLAGHPDIAAADRAILGRHVAALDTKHAHRRFLDDKRTAGMRHAMLPLLGHPRRLLGIARAIVRDKFGAPSATGPIAARLLFGPDEFE